MSIGKRIEELRVSRGYNQTELAHLAQLKPPAISQYESGIRTPSNNALSKLTKALGTSSDYLLYGGNETNNTERTILSLFNSLPDKSKEHALSYLKFLSMGNYK